VKRSPGESTPSRGSLQAVQDRKRHTTKGDQSMKAQEQAIGFTPDTLFSNGYVAGSTLYVAGQQGPDSNGKVTSTDITLQTTNAIAAVKQVAEDAGFAMTDIVSVTVYFTDLNDVPKMNEVYRKLIPDPKPARVALQVAG
jgi:2-iminobutanoate/2-iminopropanoate deaminase